jgi:hypothetical protein
MSLSYREIVLTKGQVAIVDEADVPLLGPWKWRANWDKTTQSFYAVRTEGWKRKYSISMHRTILGLPFGDPRIGDHINHDTLDNRRSNLRIVEPLQSTWNKRVYKNNVLGLKGVRINGNGRYAARISRPDGFRQSLGTFASPEEAYFAYCKAVTEQRGEFGNT